MMRRDHALEILKPRVNRQLVVAVYQTLFDWMEIHPRDLNYVATGAMGQASSHGLGLALANPDREVLVFDGDGSLLMNLGTLVSIAGAAPRNFHHFVFVNGVYEVNGEHPIPGAGKTDFATLARGAGYREVVEFDDLDKLESGIDAFLAQPGPALAVMHIESGAAYPRDYAYIHSAAARERFRRALAAS